MGVALVVLALALAVALPGCILPGTKDAAGNGGPQGNATPAEVIEVSLGDKLPARLEPVWTHEYDRPVIASLSSDGQYLLVGRSFGSVRSSTQWSAIAYTADGEELWRKAYDRSRYRTIEVDIIGPEPVFAVSLFAYSNSGNLYLYSPAGESLWTRTASCSVCLKPNADGSRVFGIDRGRRQLFLAETATGNELAHVPVTLEAALQVAPTGHALVTDPASITLISAAGKVIGQVKKASEFASVELGPSGDAIYGATRGADSTVYRYNAAGELVWQTKVQVGGSNTLAASPDGRYVAVYNVGLDNGFILLDSTDGKVVRRVAFKPVEGVSGQFIKWVRFLPEDGGLLVDYAVARNPASGHIEEHSLLWFDNEGAYRARCQFGPNADILTATDGRTCVVVNTMPLDYDAPSTNKIQLFDLKSLYSR